jgi:hypothetical protein
MLGQKRLQATWPIIGGCRALPIHFAHTVYLSNSHQGTRAQYLGPLGVLLRLR